ncbi:DegT/DnrJ/EryC1/StrS family aminotransferase [Pectobacterium punjabense]|uniref:DegT/DnrJ/EryC1/StrS family aminotransferase n=1 Tax=Pectobacterium punjabense TaxID=2108399 RepID=UPI002B24AF57|nr:DegT/DnrJ/EryC1/StrS family aminotransferase [Pectobacterium punjabense]
MTKYTLASSTWGEEEISAIHRVIDSNIYTMGESVSQYEKNFADYFGSRYCVMVSSGSAANLLMIASLFFTKNPKLKRGDEVIVPAVSWSTTYYPLQQYGLKVKFVDIDRETLNLDLTQLESAITENTKAIFAVNLLGNPNDFSKINEIIAGRDILVLEDNCESMGATLGKKQAGSFGLMGTFSSFFSHHIATMEGGCIITDDEELYHILLCIRAHGWTRNLPEINHVTGKKSNNFFEESFKFVLPGYNVRPLEMSGAIGIEQLKKFPAFLNARRANAEIFTDLFSDHKYVNIQKEVGQSSWFGFALILKENAPICRNELAELLVKNSIDVRPIVAGNFAKNDVMKWFDYSIHGTLDNSDYIDQNGLFVGNHHYELKNEIKYLHSILTGL